MYLTPKDIMGADENQLKTYLAEGLITPIDIERTKAIKARMGNMAQAQQAPQNKTVVDRIAEEVEKRVAGKMAEQSMAGVGALPVPDVMQEKHFAGGGIVAFNKGGAAKSQFDYSNPYVPEDILRAVHGVESKFGTATTPYGFMVSPAGATGHFQFMPSTAKEYGLSREDTYDFGKSKIAAAKFLARLHNQFGNWEDAVAAYNWGPGNMAAYKKTGKSLKGLDRPAESVNYPVEIQKYLGPNAGFLNRRGVLASGVGERFPVESDKTTSSAAPMDALAYLKQESEAAESEYKKQTDETRKFFTTQRGGLKGVESPNEEKIRADYIRNAEAGVQPLREELRGMVEKNRPDSGSRRKQSFYDALIEGGAAMGESRQRGLGGLLQGASRGIAVGNRVYNQGIDSLRKDEAAIALAEQRLKEAEISGKRDNLKAAENAVENAMREHRVDTRAFTQDKKSIDEAEFRSLRDALTARGVSLSNARAIAIQLMRDTGKDADRDARLKVAEIRAGGAGPGSGRVDQGKLQVFKTLEAQRVAMLKDDRGFRTYKATQRAAGLPFHTDKEKWAIETLIKNSPFKSIDEYNEFARELAKLEGPSSVTAPASASNPLVPMSTTDKLPPGAKVAGTLN